MYVNWLRKTKPTLLKTHRVMRRRNACTKLYRRRKPTFVANVVLCSRTSSNPTFIGVIMRWCLVFTAARTDWMLWTKPWSTFSIRLVSAPTCRCTPWRNDSVIWKSTAASRAWTMRSAWCAFSKTMNKLKSNSVPTCPVLTWPGREVCVYFHPCLRYLSGTGWEICRVKPARRDLSDRQKKRFATNFERFDDVERRTMQDLISSYRAGLDWSTNDLEKLPLPLRHALFRFSVAVCKNKWTRGWKIYFFIITHHILYRIFYFSRKLSDQML